jgi:asparagine synthase (glutamine-hydrolysing)
VFVSSRLHEASARKISAAHAIYDRSLSFIGRVRLDGREELCSTLFDSSVVSGAISDAEIFLRAYRRWGDRCLERLRGDFCFALWDESKQRLFCGRDHLGIRALFYAKTGGAWIVSDSLEFVVSGRLNSDLDEYWIADFLTFGFSVDFERTVYSNVKRLPPAHFLSLCRESVKVEKYWTLQIHRPIYYRRRSDYIDHFHEVVGLAVKDRLPDCEVGISMSGGLDSPTLAAHALRLKGDASKVIAHTRYFQSFIADEEKRYGELVAKRLGIRIVVRAIDEGYDPSWYCRDAHTLEPSLDTIFAESKQVIAAEMRQQAEVWLLGEGPDNALAFEWRAYLKWLFRSMRWLYLSRAVFEYVRGKQVREWHSTLANFMKAQAVNERQQLSEAVPFWLNDTLVKELQLVERVSSKRGPEHPWHPRALASFNSSIWQSVLGRFDNSVSRTPLDWRHPYLDLRVLTFLLSVPPIPWGRRKQLMREAMQGWLPTEILCRDKTPIPRDYVAAMVQKYGLPQISKESPVSRFVDLARLPTVGGERFVSRAVIRAYVLDAWLRSNAERSRVSGRA